MSAGLFRRCGCRDENGRQYGVLPERPADAQRDRACPRMLSDPKHGRWSYRLSAGIDPMTKKRRQVNGRMYATKREAKKARDETALKLGKGTYVAPSRESFADYLPKWLAAHAATGKGLRPSSVENYRRYIEQDIAPSTLGGMQLGDIRRHHINAFIDQLAADGRGAVTVRRIVAVVQGSLRAAAIEQRIEENPATLLRLPIVESKQFTPWEPEQVGAFLDTSAKHRLGPLFELAVLAGLRRGELVGLRWEHVDLERAQVRVWENAAQAGSQTVTGATKTPAGSRIVDLDDRSVGALMAWRLTQEAEASEWGAAWEGDGQVFTYENGTPLKPQYVTRLFERLRRQAGAPPMTLHGLRHMHASLMIASGAPLAVISKRLGHSSVSVTSDIYGHLIGSASRDAANGAAALIPKGTAHTLHTHQSANIARATPTEAGMTL